MSFFIAFLIALVLVPALRTLAFWTGMVDRPEDPGLAIHPAAVPVLGGPAVIAAAVAATLSETDLSVWLITATVAALIIGLIDDIRPLPASVRLGGLVGVGLLLIAGGIDVAPLGVFAGAVAVLATVAAANGANLLDGQNGLAGGLSAIAAVALAFAAPGGSQLRGLGFALAGAMIAFLLWNLPGRVFLGNGGAYAVGTLLAVLAIQLASDRGWSGLVGGMACLGVFGFELAFTVARRLASGARLTSGDRLHAYDILASGRSRTASTIMFWVIGAVCGGLGIVVSRSPLAAGLVAVAAVATGGCVWGVRLWAMRYRVAEPS
jgi:UDP-GlcNAc:undecaprenyl-phosphate GlcNAc-1-phosphate transferase